MDLYKELLELIQDYSIEEQNIINKAYETANLMHREQKRQSGEPYIIHPLNVSIILANMKADASTIAAGLLHDVLEDCDMTKEELIKEFNSEIAMLVDGVTKITNLDLSSKNAIALANTRKIITSVMEDVRIIIIKLADRLHNMKTLEFMKSEKQQEKSLETLEVFVPLANYIGAFLIKGELEELALKYLKPEEYESVSGQMQEILEKSKEILDSMIETITYTLEKNNINYTFKTRIKNIYRVYKKLSKNMKLNDIHDLLALKIVVDDIPTCYQVLGLVHSLYPPFNSEFKDYIVLPKTNLYQSLHTTVFAPNDMFVQVQIRTSKMDLVSQHGLATYWHLNKSDARFIMQERLKEKFQFFASLNEIDHNAKDNEEFIMRIRQDLFSNRIYVYTTKGDIIELPSGSTPIDFAYNIHTDIGNKMIGVVVNDQYVDFNYILKTKDVVKIIISDTAGKPDKSWIELAKTSIAKRRISEFLNKNEEKDDRQ